MYYFGRFQSLQFGLEQYKLNILEAAPASASLETVLIPFSNNRCRHRE